MDITTQKFLMGSAGAGGQNYWIISFTQTPRSDTRAGNKAMVFTSTGDMVIATAKNPDATIFRMDDEGSIVWKKSFSHTGSYEYYPTFRFGNISIDPSDQVTITGKVYDYYDSGYGGGIAKLDSNGNLSSLRYLRRGAGAYYGGSHVRLSNGRVAHWGEDTYVNLSGTDGYSNYLNYANYRISTYSGAIGPTNTTFGNYLQTDGSYIYLLGSVQGEYAGDNTERYFAILTLSGSLYPIQRTYYRIDANPYNNPSPFDFVRVNDGHYVTFTSNNYSNYSAHVMYSTSAGVQWVKYLNPITYNQSDGVGPYLTADALGNAYLVTYADGNRNSLLILKYNPSGDLIWKRNLTGLDNNIEGIGKIQVYDGALYILVSGIVCKLSLDGDGVGTYGPYTYSESSFTDAPGLTTLTKYSGGGGYNVEGTLTPSVRTWAQPTYTITTTQYEI